jgi:hypothetical protein
VGGGGGDYQNLPRVQQDYQNLPSHGGVGGGGGVGGAGGDYQNLPSGDYQNLPKYEDSPASVPALLLKCNLSSYKCVVLCVCVRVCVRVCVCFLLFAYTHVLTCPFCVLRREIFLMNGYDLVGYLPYVKSEDLMHMGLTADSDLNTLTAAFAAIRPTPFTVPKVCNSFLDASLTLSHTHTHTHTCPTECSTVARVPRPPAIHPTV